MIFIAFTDDEIYFKSDTSTKELNEFCEKLTAYTNRQNKHNLGVYSVATNSYRFRNNEKVFLEKLDNTEIKYEILDYYEWHEKALQILKDIVPTTEKVIREATEKLLKEKHEFYHFQTEFTHTSLNVRTDLFGVTKDRKVISVEIKSDRDSLIRLEKQLTGYSVFSHIVYIATDIKHFAKIERMVSTRGNMWNVGILVYEDGELTEHKKPNEKTRIDTKDILWKQEFVRMLCDFSFKGKNASPSHKLEGIAMRIFTVVEYAKICEHLFVERYAKEDVDASKLLSLYEDHEYKQKLVDRLTT